MSDADFKVLKEKLATLINLDRICPKSMCKKLTRDELLKLKTYYESNPFIKEMYDTVEKALKEQPSLKKELPIEIPRIRIPEDIPQISDAAMETANQKAVNEILGGTQNTVTGNTAELSNAEASTQTYSNKKSKKADDDIYDGKLDATIFGKLSATPADAVKNISPQSTVSGKVQDLIKDEAALRTMIRDEILNTRNVPALSNVSSSSTSSVPTTDGLKQGSSYSELTKDPSVTCPPPPKCPPPIGGCGKYIRKDSIPCWGCSLK
jgi:hypothetical protein